MPAKVVRRSTWAPIRPAAKVPRPSQSTVVGLVLLVKSGPAMTCPEPNWALLVSTPVPRTATRTPPPVVSGQTADGSSRDCGHGRPVEKTPLALAQPAPGARGTPPG